MHIALIGGAGFIGTELAKVLLAQGHEVRILDVRNSNAYPALSQRVDVCDPEALIDALTGIDIIYNLAAEHRDDVRPARLYDEVNVDGARHIVAAAEANNIQTVIFTSTVAVYGLNAGKNKGGSSETDVPDPFNEYGRSKLKAEKVLKEWSNRNENRHLSLIRLTATFGPGGGGNMRTLIDQMARRRFVMVGPGSNTKSLAYIDNVAEFLSYAITFGPGVHLYNYADKPDLTTRELITYISQILDTKPLAHMPYSVGLAGGYIFDALSVLLKRSFSISASRVRKFCADTVVNADKAHASGFRAPVSLKDGLKSMIRSRRKKKTLLYIISHMDWFWSHRLPLVLGAHEAGWDIIIAASGAEEDKRLAELGVKAVNIPDLTGVLSALKAVWRISGLIHKYKPDLMHAITLKYVFIAGLARFFHPRVRAVYTVAGLGWLFSSKSRKAEIFRQFINPLLKLIFKGQKVRVIVQNPDDRKILTDGGFVAPEQCILIRGSGVNVEQFSYTPDPEDNVPLILMPTRLVWDKGISIFVEAARILNARGIKARFQIAGALFPDNPNAVKREDMEAMTADGIVEWLGKVTDMPDLLRRTTLVVYPSYYGEGVPKVLLEAMATGRAIITTDHPGCREAVIDRENGLLVPIRDAGAVAHAVEVLLEDSSLRTAMGKKGRQFAENHFSTDHVVSGTLDVYRIEE